MSTRTTFHHGPPDGLVSLIVQQSERFSAWYETTMHAYPENALPKEPLQLGRAIAAGDTSVLQPRSAEAARHVDRLVAAFCFDFDNAMSLNGLDILPVADDSSHPRDYYTETFAWLGQHTSPFVQTMGGYLLTGRGIGRDPTRWPYYPVYPNVPDAIGFWTAEEVVQLHAELSLLPLPDHNPMLTGFWALRKALESARACHGALILLSV